MSVQFGLVLPFKEHVLRQWRILWLGWMSVAILGGCAEPRIKPSDQHLAPAARPVLPPLPLAAAPSPPPAASRQPTRLYSVAVENAPVRELLFAIARDARLELDVATDIEGTVTLNARDRTLPHILDRIAAQTDLRWEIREGVIRVERDTPFLRHYRIDYINLARESEGELSVSSQVGGASASGGGGGANASSATVRNRSETRFWEVLVANVRDLLRETDKILPGAAEGGATPGASSSAAPPASASGAAPAASGAGGGAAAASAAARPVLFREAASVIANPITGTLSVRATAKQHEKVREYLDRVLAGARRQVLIEATIVEVVLNRQSQSGIDWKTLVSGAGFTSRANFVGTSLDAAGSRARPDPGLIELISSIQGNDTLTDEQKFNLVNQIYPGHNVLGTQPPLVYPEAFTGGAFPFTGDARGFTIGYGSGSNLAAALRLLGQYGTVKVVSSPKVTTLNNQPAVLRVVENHVYFTVQAQTTTGGSGPSTTTITSTPNTVAVGFVMSVLPQVDDGSVVSLHVRPTITRLRGYVRDPNPNLRDVPSLVPIVQSKELESSMKVPSGQIVMLGGLMEDSQVRDTETLPGVEDSPVAGLFGTRRSSVGKTELVIFLRPVVIADPSIDGDFAFAKNRLPGKEFFSTPQLPWAPASPTLNREGGP